MESWRLYPNMYRYAIVCIDSQVRSSQSLAWLEVQAIMTTTHYSWSDDVPIEILILTLVAEPVIQITDLISFGSVSCG